MKGLTPRTTSWGCRSHIREKKEGEEVNECIWEFFVLLQGRPDLGVLGERHGYYLDGATYLLPTDSQIRGTLWHRWTGARPLQDN